MTLAGATAFTEARRFNAEVAQTIQSQQETSNGAEAHPSAVANTVAAVAGGAVACVACVAVVTVFFRNKRKLRVIGDTSASEPGLLV